MSVVGNSEWYSEICFRGSLAMSYKIKNRLHCEQSKYQKIEVIDTESVGRFLLLDGKGMVSERDEFVYHEVMAHIPYMVKPELKKVLIIGGGDGGVAREFLRHPDVERVDLIEIDERVVEVTKQFLPEVATAFADPRLNFLPMDGIEFIKGKENEYDVAIIDSTDPEDFAEGLFTKEFYASVKKSLKDDGIMMAQTENPFLDEYNLKSIYDNLRAAYPNVQSFFAPMLVYPGVFWTFAFASKGIKGNELLASKRAEMEKMQKDLKWYNMDWHEGAFKLSNIHKRVLGFED